MLEDDILGEKHAVAQYEKMLSKLKNPTVKALIKRIKEDEILHVQTLEKILNAFDG